jgi:signal transduction histidine kinase/ActR/RegA family two-component response regulator
VGPGNDVETRVLVLAPTGRDAAIASALLAKDGITTEVCGSIDELCDRYAEGAGAALIAEEALGSAALARLLGVLRQQPPWSDFPLVLLTSRGETTWTTLRTLDIIGPHANVTLLERPVRAVTLQATVRVALRARRRQIEKRDYLAEREALLVELEHERERLRDTDRRKDQFLAMLGHELRNPMAPLTNALRLARVDSHRLAALEMAERQVGHLGRLLDDLLDVSRITQGKITLHKEPVELREVVQLALEATRHSIDSRAHTLGVTLPPEPLVIDADRARLAQVLVNLLTNAAKYTDPGGRLMLGVERADGEIVLRVSDNGVGIAPEMLGTVFDLFTQAERSLERAEGGLGIGLTLVRSLVEMHGGTVEARSAGADRGAEFVVRLPAPQAAAAPRQSRGADRTAPAAALRVLVVDDNHDAAASLASLLGLWGHQVAVAHDGAHALETARAFTPDVVLLDIGLPGIDGYEVARRLRREAGLPRPVLIALSGYGQETDRHRGRDAGFDEHLVKPVDPDVICDLLRNAERTATRDDEAVDARADPAATRSV